MFEPLCVLAQTHTRTVSKLRSVQFSCTIFVLCCLLIRAHIFSRQFMCFVHIIMPMNAFEWNNKNNKRLVFCVRVQRQLHNILPAVRMGQQLVHWVWKIYICTVDGFNKYKCHLHSAQLTIRFVVALILFFILFADERKE